MHDAPTLLPLLRTHQVTWHQTVFDLSIGVFFINKIN